MTKIFEALENAGLERYQTIEPQAITMPYPQIKEAVPYVHVEKTAELPTQKLEKIVSSLYQNIVTLLPNAKSRIVQFQGSQAGEGTSTLIRELAKVAAFQLGKSVLLLDVNQTDQNQCSSFNVRSDWSWDEIDRNDKSFKEIFAQIKQSSLYVTRLPVNGTPISLICELPQVEPFLNKLKEEFDLILIDSPSAITCTHCLMLSPKVDGVVLVVQAGKTRWQTVEKVKEGIIAKDGKILGVVLNKRHYPIPEFIYKRI